MYFNWASTPRAENRVGKMSLEAQIQKCLEESNYRNKDINQQQMATDVCRSTEMVEKVN